MNGICFIYKESRSAVGANSRRNIILMSPYASCAMRGCTGEGPVPISPVLKVKILNVDTNESGPSQITSAINELHRPNFTGGYTIDRS